MVNNNFSEKTKDMVLIGFMAALICVMGPLSVNLPFTAVPISLTLQKCEYHVIKP